MKIVVDSNMMQSPRLDTFLSRKTNIAVITDFTMLEAVKPTDIDAFYKQIEIILKYPLQVLILKDCLEIAQSSHQTSELPASIVDIERSNEFQLWPIMMNEARREGTELHDALRELQATAQDQAAEMMASIGDLSVAITEFKKFITPKELLALRKGAMPDELKARILFQAIGMSEKYNADRPSPTFIPTSNRGAVNNFAFRLSLFQIVYLIDLVSNGPKHRAPAKARNDQIDLYMGTYATYFDGFLTADKMAFRNYCNTRQALSTLGAKISKGRSSG